MCGRYRRTTREEELARIYRIPIPAQPDLPISYNIAPNRPVLAIRYNPETKQRSLDTLLWGLVPYWSKDGKTGFINARAERIDIAPAFRRPFQKRRCLISTDGFYEWKKTPEGKVPYSIEMKDSSPFVFAGLWDGWQNPDSKEWLRTCVIITGEPNGLVAQIHNRMPVILPAETHERWLSGEFGQEILRPFPAKEISARRISRRINKPENNDPSVLEEDETEQTGRLI
jgi:putative SOS response-associated peptidase YedK